MDRSSRSGMLFYGRSFLDRFCLCLYRLSKSSENFSKGLRLVKAVLSLSYGRQIKVKFDLVVAIRQAKRYLTAFAIFIAAGRISTRVFDIRDEVCTQIARQI
jgi:hypothetical protein